VSAGEPKRALILAGGGLKVAFQAGVLQVWLDEAGLEFEIADGSSGGVFNLAMWCTGKTGTQIADAWRQTNPLDFFAINARPWVALSSLGRFRKKVLPSWEVDWSRIERPNATFNAYNFTRQKLETIAPGAMNDDWLLACVSLPTWFTPVRINGDLYVDAVYATDSNLEAAIENGADEHEGQMAKRPFRSLLPDDRDRGQLAPQGHEAADRCEQRSQRAKARNGRVRPAHRAEDSPG